MEDTVEVKKPKKKIVKSVDVAKSSAKNSNKKKKIACIAAFVIGIMLLVAGIVVLVLSILKGSAVADGEYLVAAENWALTDCGNEDCDKVVWKFTEIGKGSLTTDGGEHNYDFEWAIKDGKLDIQTNWLYELDNEYEYSLDQSNGVLTLRDIDTEEDAEVEYRFAAQP